MCRPSRKHLADYAVLLQTEAAHEIKADLPGVSKESVKLSVDRPHHLTLTVAEAEEASSPAEADSSKAWRLERSSRYAARTLRLPETADLAAAKASLQDGVLTISVPKRDPQPSQHTIAIE